MRHCCSNQCHSIVWDFSSITYRTEFPGGEPSRQSSSSTIYYIFFFQAEHGIRDLYVTGVQTCALPILAQMAGVHALSWAVVESGRFAPTAQDRACAPAICAMNARNTPTRTGAHGRFFASRPLMKIGRASCRERV